LSKDEKKIVYERIPSRLRSGQAQPPLEKGGVVSNWILGKFGIVNIFGFIYLLAGIILIYPKGTKKPEGLEL
tara:strand:+ start:159 stop:374 length:216 start_codon:yes stop_codon:yes gene_type:complete